MSSLHDALWAAHSFHSKPQEGCHLCAGQADSARYYDGYVDAPKPAQPPVDVEELRRILSRYKAGRGQNPSAAKEDWNNDFTDWIKKHAASLLTELATRREQVQYLEGELQRAQVERRNLYGALASIWNLIHDGVLVRDIRRDSEPGWAMRCVPLVKALSAAEQALARSTAEPEGGEEKR